MRLALCLIFLMWAGVGNAATYQWYSTPISSTGTALSGSTLVTVWFGPSSPTNPSNYNLIIIDSNADGLISRNEWGATTGGGLGHNGATSISLFHGNNTGSGTLYTGSYIVAGTGGHKAGLVSNFSAVNPNNINVVDTTAPVITVAGDNPATVVLGASYLDAGASCTDNLDASCTVTPSGSVNTSAAGTYTITYSATDAAGNTATATRTVEVVAGDAPVITLLGLPTVTIEVGSSYTDAGATAQDTEDGDLTTNIVVGGDSVDPATVGTYTITYDVSDSSGNAAAQVTRTVNVVDTTAPTVEIKSVPAIVEGPFFIDVEFSREVTGFDRSDITLVNASVDSFEDQSSRRYRISLSPTSDGEVRISIAAGVAEDKDGIRNSASNVLYTIFRDTSAIQRRTRTVIKDYLLQRADNILSSEPNLTSRLKNRATQGTAGASQAEGLLRAQFDGQANLSGIGGWNNSFAPSIWAEVNLRHTNSLLSDTHSVIGYIGLDAKLTDDVLVGTIFQFDDTELSNKSLGFSAEGTGFMAGPYVVAALSDNLTLDARAAWGSSSNEISPYETYKDKFDSKRSLYRLAITGSIALNSHWNLNPQSKFLLYKERTGNYIDSVNTSIEQVSVTFGRLTFGPSVERKMNTNFGQDFAYKFGIEGIWDFRSSNRTTSISGLDSGDQEFRARALTGLDIDLGNVTISTELVYDGIGVNDYESVSGQIRLSIEN